MARGVLLFPKTLTGEKPVSDLAADDERNPPETGVTDAAMKHVKNGKLYLIPASTATRGHLTTGNARFFAPQLQELLQTAPQRTM